MSHIDPILGLSVLVVERVERNQGIHAWAKPKTRPACMFCSSESLCIKATHSRTLKHTRQGNQIMIVHLRVHKYHCRNCNRHFICRPPFVL